MKTLISLNPGEYLVGAHLEPRASVWVPSKDVGVDLLVTNADRTRSVGLQVKEAKDFVPDPGMEAFRSSLLAAGWWTFNLPKIAKSTADPWVLVIKTFEAEPYYIVISPADLHKRLQDIHKPKNPAEVHSYLWVTKSRKCWEVRGLSPEDRERALKDTYSNAQRDFTAYLNNWTVLWRKLGVADGGIP